MHCQLNGKLLTKNDHERFNKEMEQEVENFRIA